MYFNQSSFNPSGTEIAESCESQVIMKGRLFSQQILFYNGVEHVDKFKVCFNEFHFSFKFFACKTSLDFPGFL